MGRKKSAPQQSSRTERSEQRHVQEPWGPQANLYRDLYHQAADLTRTNPTFFPGQTYANFAPETEESLTGIAARARAGSPLNRAAQASLLDVLRPDFATNNPVYKAALSANLSSILPQLQSQFALAGGARSGLARAAEQEAASNVAAKLGLDFMGMQERARGAAPGLANQDYFDLGQLGQVGGAREGMAQNAINEAMARHEFLQNRKRQQLYDYAALIGGNVGGDVVTTATGGLTNLATPYGGSRVGGALGGALGGASLGSSFGPVGAGVGGLLGALGGFF